MAKICCTKNSNKSFLLLAPAANMFGTSRFFIGRMIWQHAVILESICETNSIIIFLPAQWTGLFTPLLICFTLHFFSLLLGQIILSPTPFLPFTFLEKSILSPIPLPSSLWTKLFPVDIPSSLWASWTKKSNSKSTKIFEDNVCHFLS